MDELNFLSITEVSQNPGRSDRRIVILPRIHQFGRIRIGAKIFGSVNAPRYMRSSFIRAKFVQTEKNDYDYYLFYFYFIFLFLSFNIFSYFYRLFFFLIFIAYHFFRLV